MRAEAFRGDPTLAERAREAALGIPGVTRFDSSARTGSFLIEYQPGLAEPDRILEQIAQATGVTPCPPDTLARARTPALIAVGAIQELNEIAAELTGHRADLRALVPTGLAALSAYSFVTSKEPRLPRWDNLLWWSYSVFLNHHRADIDASAEERRLARLARDESVVATASRASVGPSGT